MDLVYKFRQLAAHVARSSPGQPSRYWFSTLSNKSASSSKLFVLGMMPLEQIVTVGPDKSFYIFLSARKTSRVNAIWPRFIAASLSCSASFPLCSCRHVARYGVTYMGSSLTPCPSGSIQFIPDVRDGSTERASLQLIDKKHHQVPFSVLVYIRMDIFTRIPNFNFHLMSANDKIHFGWST